MKTICHSGMASGTLKGQASGICTFAIFLLVFAFLSGDAVAATRTFPKGSYIIPEDICWQANKDPKTWEICNNGKDDDADGTVDEANTASTPYACIDLTGCDPNQSDQGIFQSTGLVYDILASGFPVYWIINPNKTSQVAVDLSVTKSGSDPAVTIYHSAKTNSDPLTTVNYMGGPFVIDANDMEPAIQTLFDKYANAKIHKANYDFSAEVDKVLSGSPPKVAVLNEGSADVLTDYLFASGLGNTMYDIFQYITSPEIVAGGLKDFQLLWAPHWVIDKQSPVSAADRPNVVGGIRKFLEAGNAGFFECASIQSLERGYDHKRYNSTYVSPSGDYGGGFLLDKNYLDANGRIETNGTNLDKSTLVFEYPTNVLTQCGGWDFRPVIGVTEDLRPSQIPATDYVYNGTVQRFVHDNDASGMGAPKGYDYFLGGRINGNATQGYVAYLGGHKYVQCSNATVATPVTRQLSLEFNADLDHSGSLWVEVAYAGCSNAGTALSTCPKAMFSLGSMSGSSATDASGKIFIDLDSAMYGPDADPPTKYILSNIIVGNKDPLAGNTITGIYVTFEGNPTTTHLVNILDTSNVVDPLTDIPVTVCSPNAQSPASCPSYSKRYFDLNFDAPLAAGTVVTVEAVHGACTSGVNCPTATYDLASNAGTWSQDSAIGLEMWNGFTSYDAVNNKLKNVFVWNTSTTAKTLTALNVTFPGSGATKLTTIQDVTSTSALACTSNSASPAKCPATVVTPVSNQVTFSFNNNISYPFSLKANYSGSGACASGSFTATYPGSGAKVFQDSCIKVDMSGTNFSTTSLVVTLSSLDSANINVNSYTVSWGGTAKLGSIVSSADGTLWKASKKSNYLSSPASPAFSRTHTLKVSTFGNSMSISLTPYTPISLALGQAVSSCTINWSQANTCGIKYILNTLIGLQFQIVPNEYDKAGAIQKDNILYKGTFEFPGYKGHLYSIDVTKNPAVVKWDAGKKSIMPPAGSGNPGLVPSNTNTSRYIFTNLPGTVDNRTPFDTTVALTLQPYLDPSGSKTINSVKALINSVRGRKDASDTNTVGIGEVSKKLGGIEHSSPAVMGRSDVAGAENRDRIVFVGADDGMLHAFYAGEWDSLLNGGKGAYKDFGTGKEIWAYIPRNLLGSLQNETFTDCNPGETVNDCVVTATVNCKCPTYSNAVSVDSSPIIGDFYVDDDDNSATPKVWRTILVATGLIYDPHVAGGNVEICGNGVDDDADGVIDEADCFELTVNKGIIFALDVTDPYNPSVLWERTYNTPVDPSAAPKITYRNYYPDKTIFPSEDTLFDPNMGNSRGVSIGRVQVGTKLDTYVFVTSKWVRKVNIGSVATPHDVWGMSVYALNFYNGDIVWETKLMYTGDAEGINETPARPVLLDDGNNGTDDYVIFGDMQGRLWVLRTTDGVNMTTIDQSDGSKILAKGDTPAFTVKKADGSPAGATEPIGAMVAVSGNSIVFGTGGRDSLLNEETTKYRTFALKLTGSGIKDMWNVELGAGEKVYAQPVISTKGSVYFGTAKGYTDIGRPDVVGSGSTSGNFFKINLASGEVKVKVAVDGPVVGPVAVENNHVTVLTLDGDVEQFGKEDFKPDTSPENPIKTLWWRSLQQ